MKLLYEECSLRTEHRFGQKGWSTVLGKKEERNPTDDMSQRITARRHYYYNYSQ